MKYIKISIFLGVVLSIFLSTQLAFAAEVKPPVIPRIPNLPALQDTTQEAGGSAIRAYVLNTFGGSFLKGFLGIVAAASVIFIIIGGIQMLLAMGNEEALTTAKKTLLWAILGLVIAILSAAIVQIVTTLPFQPPPRPGS